MPTGRSSHFIGGLPWLGIGVCLTMQGKPTNVALPRRIATNPLREPHPALLDALAANLQDGVMAEDSDRELQTAN